MGIGASTSPPSATLQVEPLAGPAMLERPGPAGGPARTGGIRLFILRRILQGLLVLVLVSIVVFAALPEFVVGVALVVLFATTVFHFLPAITLIPPGGRPWDQPIAIILPTLTLVLAVTPYVVRIMRASMVEVLESDYVEMARLKGLPERIVLRRHALPNALGPTFQVIAINLAYLAGGVIVVEYIFNYAGIGGALRDAVANRDIPVVQALAMAIASLYVVLNLLADIATILVTPRLRTRL